MSAAKLGDIPVTSIVKIKESGAPVDFYVAAQDYESELNGTGRVLVVRKDLYKRSIWQLGASNGGNYKSSEIDKVLRTGYVPLLGESIGKAMATTKIKYAYDHEVSTMSTKAFLLSARELGSYADRVPDDGTPLEQSVIELLTLNAYFSDEEKVNDQWTRSLYKGGGYAWYCNYTGRMVYTNLNSKICLRPAFTLPADADVDDDGMISVNTSPSIPDSITVPNSIQGGTTITVSWGTSTDTEENLEGYVVQRSTDGGSSWNQIYQGSGRSTTNTVAFGTTSVMYRVKAYDTEGLQSGWRTSSQITVNNNTAPTAPASITVPDAANGGQALTISWGVSTDKEGNLAGYKLERQVNGGSWSEIYEGSDTFYTDTIVKGWNSVGYRVRAYDTLGAASEYVTGTTRTVNNNTAPTISGQDASLGLKTGGFSQTYTVSDAEGDSVTVTEYVDSTQIRSYTATLGQQATVTLTREMWLTLTNGTHQLRVEATDGKATTARIWTFSKKETVICFRLAAPEETDTAATKIIVSPTWQIAGATAKVEACNNAFDENPAWEDITAMIALNRVYNFINKTKTASKWGIDFRFTITKNEGYDGEVSISGFGGAYE